MSWNKLTHIYTIDLEKNAKAELSGENNSILVSLAAADQKQEVYR